MNLLKFKNAEDLLNKTGWPVEEALRIVAAELNKFKKDEKPPA